jgi:mRNA interferase MazF
MVISQGDVCWVDLGRPVGSEPVLHRPVVVIQCDAFNRSRISTVVCVTLTANLARAGAPGSVLLSTEITGLPKDSVADASQLLTVDRRALRERVGALPPAKLKLVLAAVEVVLGR